MPRMTAVLTLFVLSLFHQPVLATSPFHVWSKTFGDTNQEQGYDVAVDSQGNVIITGFFQNTVDFGGDVLTSNGSLDVFVAKFDRDGNHIWSYGFGGLLEQVGTTVAVDASDNIVVGGYAFGSINFGGSTLTSAGSSDIFVVKFTAGGTHLWSKRFGAGAADFLERVVIDAGQNVILTGSFQLTVDFGGGGLVSAGSSDVYLVKLDSAGNHAFSKRFGDASSQSGSGVEVDASSNIVLAGTFGGAIDFGGGALNSAGQNDIFLARFESDGDHIWSKRFGDASGQQAADVAVDADGGVILGGTFFSTVDFGGGLLTSAGGDDLYLAKFTSGGIPLWSSRYGDGNVNGTLAVEIATDSGRNIIVTGGFLSSVDFGGGALTSAGQTDLFHARFNPDGVWMTSDRSGDASGQFSRGIAVDSGGSVLLTGSHEATLDLGGGPLVAVIGGNGFFAKFRSSQPGITTIGDVGNDQGRSVRIRFARSGFDAGGAGEPILSYAAFRRIDPLPAGVVERDAVPSDKVPGEQLIEGWEFVGSIPAFAENEYSMIVPTLADSTVAAGQHYSVFFVRAATASPSIHFDSAPDSGYSLDNLAPGVPSSFAYVAGVLSWDESNALDFDFFSVYGSNTNSFGSATLVDYTTGVSLDVSGEGYAYFFVTATDFSGNESAPAVLSAPTDVGGTPTRYVLSVGNYPNPFNPSTTVSYTVPSRGPVTVTIYDARGAQVMTLVDHEERAAGGYRLAWDGRNDRGTLVTSGVYFARIEHGGVVRSKKMVLVK